MGSVDDKIVSASFESSKFEEGVSKTINAINKLKEALNFDGAGKGLENVNAAAKSVDLSHIGNAVDDVKGRLNAFRLVAINVFSEVATKALSAGEQFAKSFTLGPIIAGFQEYSVNLNAIQTILANTQASGATLKDVNSALNDLNHYSDKTIYNFTQMAKNIGTFTAAGVDLKTSTEAIKGIANLAALSGSNADQASTAMYQLSQAIAAGQVHLQDWNSVVNAGMGGTVFQRALAQTAEAMGTLKKGTLKLVGPMKNVSINGESFRQSMQAKPGQTSWLTSKVLTTTLKQFTGDLSDAQLKTMGFNEAQIKSIQLTAKTAEHAATEVKTISQVLDVAKETAGSGWTASMQIIFGNFVQAKKTFTGLSNAINNIINTSAKARNKILADWKALGGRTILIDSIKTAFHNLGAILKPIRDAFRDIFPRKSGKDLLVLTKQFEAFAKALKPSPETVDNLRRTFRGLFALLDIGKQVVRGIFTVFTSLFKSMGAGKGGFLNFTGNVGDLIVSLDKAMKKGGAFNNFFKKFGEILAFPLNILSKLIHGLGNLFGGNNSGEMSKKTKQVDHLNESLSVFQKILHAIGTAWHNFTSIFSGGSIDFQSLLDGLSKFVQGIGPAIGKGATTINWELVFQAIRTGLFAGLVLMFKNFFGRGSFLTQITGIHNGFIRNIGSPFNALGKSINAMQRNINAKTLKQIAIAIALLAVSVVALSLVDPKRLSSSLGALTVAFAELLGAFVVLDKLSKGIGFAKLPLIAGSLILLASAIDILVIAVIALSRLSWGQLLKGLTGVGVLLGIIAAAVIPLSANSAGMIRVGIGLTAIAVALNLLAIAVKVFSTMSWTELGKGLGAVGVALGVIAASTRAMPKNMVAIGTGLVVIALALRIVADVVSVFGKMDWLTIGKGLLGIGGALVIIAGALRLMPDHMISMGLGLLAVSSSLMGLAKVIKIFGTMSPKELAKGLGAFAGSLAILAGSLRLMAGTVRGSTSLAIAAAAFALLGATMLHLGKQSWTQIIKGMVELAATLAILGAAGALLTPVIPSLLGLGAALLLIGGGLALAGAGIALIGVGISALAVAGPTGIAIMVSALIEFSKALQEVLKNAVIALVGMVKTIAEHAPEFVSAVAKIIGAIIDAIIKETPKIAKAFGTIIVAAVKFLHEHEDELIQAGFDLIIAFLTGVKNNISKIVDLGTTIIANIVVGIGRGIGKIVLAVGSIITAFLNAIGTDIKVIITAGTNLMISFIEGFGGAGIELVTAARRMMVRFVKRMSIELIKLEKGFADAIITFLNGTADVLSTRGPEIHKAFIRVGEAIITGVILGIDTKAGDLKNKIIDTAKSLPKKFWHVLGIHSPSKVFQEIGHNIIEGLVLGLNSHDEAVKSAKAMSHAVIDVVKAVFKIHSPSEVMRQIGLFVGEGFAQGLRGSTADVQNAFTDMNSKIIDGIRTTKDTIANEQAKLKADQAKLKNLKAKLKDSKKVDKKPEQEAIKQLTQDIQNESKAIAGQEALLARLKAGHTELVKSLSGERKELESLTTRYDKLGKQLENANQALADAKQTRKDAIKGFKDEFATLPDIVTTDTAGNSIDALATYMGALKHQADAVVAYTATLKQLRKLGLDDTTYQKLLADGTADQQFADQLLAGGKSAISKLNVLDANLTTAAATLAKNAGNSLYQAGVDAAQGLVDGLLSKRAHLRKIMESIAQDIVAALKKELKIKSPSEVFAEIGRLSMEGLAQGFSKSTDFSDAVDNMANDALAKMKNSVRDISNLVSGEMDLNPTITPVLDLTEVRKQSKNLSALTSPADATVSLVHASIISSAQNKAQMDQVNTAPVAANEARSLTFEQNNYSPKALSEIEIYRQTRNQLSQLRSLAVSR